MNELNVQELELELEEAQELESRVEHEVEVGVGCTTPFQDFLTRDPFIGILIFSKFGSLFMTNYSLKEQIRHANYLYTLKCLGVLDDPKNQLQAWHHYRELHAEFISDNHKCRILTEMESTGFPDKRPDTNFFLLFHHGFYFTIPYFLVKHYGYSGARFIMTEESFDQSLAAKCADAFNGDFKSIFIDDKGHFVREVIKAKRENQCIFLLTDLPFGYTDNSAEFFDAPFGKLKYRAGFMKIAKILRQPPVLITSHISQAFDKVSFNFSEIEDATGLISQLTEIYRNEFLTAERLDDLRKMCEFNHPATDFKYDFELKGKRYRYYPATEKMFALAAPVSEPSV